ncbi:hypothetical protein EGW08_008592 [Elysia chlorotica]|uniref:Uncharacterized protein n=1 Tax=Elysia chlorotica TaxID=188477 RepID=A0A3S1BLJ1_ELYCH|nr:hypothetical protein EGW08_008592 [Elysia chlorotica]
MLRPKTAGLAEMTWFKGQQRSLSCDAVNYSAAQRFTGTNGEKGILHSHNNFGTSQRKIRFRRVYSEPLSSGNDPDTTVSVYKNIEHLFQNDTDSGDSFTKSDLDINTRTFVGQSVTSRKKVIRFLDTCDNRGLATTHFDTQYCDELDNDVRYPDNIVHDSSDRANHNVRSNDTDSKEETSNVTVSSSESNCLTRQSLSGDETTNNSEFVSDEGGEDGKPCETTDTESCEKSVASANANNNGQNCYNVGLLCDELEKLSTQPAYPTNLSKQSEKSLEDNVEICEKTALPRRRPKTAIERSNSNYDATLEKCDKYLRAQSRSFTQTSQYMSNTKRGLSKLSVHYSQTNTAHNDRVIMADLLRNGHTRNALIGDGVYAIERRLYNRRRDPLKSTTFYERFAAPTYNSNAQDLPARKRKSRTVADRAKERQERINKKKEELERGFPPRAWSLVEVGAADIEHMLNTCRYLRVDIRKQPNVYGAVDLSDED